MGNTNFLDKYIHKYSRVVRNKDEMVVVNMIDLVWSKWYHCQCLRLKVLRKVCVLISNDV